MELSVVSSGGVTRTVQVYCQVSPLSDGNGKFYGGRLELGRGRVRPLATAVKGSYDGRERHVEVIGVGSRKDAVLDFCLESPYKSPALCLWTAVTKQSTKLQLQPRLLEEGCGSDHASVVDLLRGTQSPCTLIVPIVLKPFSFEGQRRPDERMLLNSNQNKMKEVNVADVIDVLRRYKEGKIGFGAGFNVETSVLQAPSECPFLGLGVKASIAQQHLSEKPKEEGILSRLVQSIPLFFNLLGKRHPEINPTLEGSSAWPVGPTDAEEPRVTTEVNAESAVAFLENDERVGLHVQSVEGNLAFQREHLKSWNYGPGYEEARVWARERRSDSSAPAIANFSMFHLPVGVKPSGEQRDSKHNANLRQNGMGENDDDGRAELLADTSPYQISSADIGLGALQNFYNAASTLLEDKCLDVSKNQGNLSVRAASMLDAERNNPRTWNPVIDMEYRGCVYEGRCQGGLPEGKGRLVVRDGSIYDGMWLNGKRLGSGTYYFSNGDVFQGSWRDNDTHGKGWFYFQTGDRWFANFWKGKANSEGCFYTKSGDVSFGDFKDGWRQGHFLCIGVDGQRFLEIWDQGILV